MAKVSDNKFPKVILEEVASDGSDTSNPAADHRAMFLGEDGSLHLRDSSGTVTDVGGSGAVATDTIWDAKGDLAAGTGANTASKLTAGANDTILMADSGQATGLKWVASQTPSTQAFGDAAAEGTADTYARGDHKHAMPASPAASNLAAAKVVLTSGDITTTSTSFVDATGLTATISTGARRVLYGLTASAFAAVGDQLMIDVAVDGTRVGGGTLGLLQFNSSTALPCTIAGMTDALSSGSHTIKVQFRSLSGGIATIRAANPGAIWWVAEIYAA